MKHFGEKFDFVKGEKSADAEWKSSLHDGENIAFGNSEEYLSISTFHSYDSSLFPLTLVNFSPLRSSIFPSTKSTFHLRT